MGLFDNLKGKKITFKYKDGTIHSGEIIEAGLHEKAPEKYYLGYDIKCNVCNEIHRVSSTDATQPVDTN